MLLGDSKIKLHEMRVVEDDTYYFIFLNVSSTHYITAAVRGILESYELKILDVFEVS
jgi:hypothetical protein